MQKIDYKKQLKYLYRPSPKAVVIVDVPEMNFLMIDGQGDPNTSRQFSDALEAKKNPVALPSVRFEAFSEGKAAQTMHIGPFSEEGPTVERLHDFIRQNGHVRTGKHHEIYLSDIRRAAPENWKTVIRQPIK